MSFESGSNPWAPEGWDGDGAESVAPVVNVEPTSASVSPASNPSFFQPSAPVTPPASVSEAEDVTVMSSAPKAQAPSADQTVMSSITLTPSRASAPLALIPRSSGGLAPRPTIEELAREGQRRAEARASVPATQTSSLSDSGSFSKSSGYGVSDSNAHLIDLGEVSIETGWVLRGIGVDQRALLACDYILGRTPSSPTKSDRDVLVTIADTTGTVSRTHARLSFDGLAWSITDLNSTNGVSLVDSRGRENPLPAGGAGVVTGKFFVGDIELELVNTNE